MLVVLAGDRPTGILPLVIRREATRVGRLRVLTFPLHDWGSFYGPIGPAPAQTLAAGLEHVRRTRREWDILELRWQGAPGTDLAQVQGVMRAAGFQAYATVWDRTALVDLAGTWESYWSGRKASLAAAISQCRAQAFQAGRNFLRALPPVGPAAR